MYPATCVIVENSCLRTISNAFPLLPWSSLFFCVMLKHRVEACVLPIAGLGRLNTGHADQLRNSHEKSSGDGLRGYCQRDRSGYSGE